MDKIFQFYTVGSASSVVVLQKELLCSLSEFFHCF